MNIIPDLLAVKNDSKMLLVILDGLGGLPSRDNKTELEFAHTPHMDKMAMEYECGLSIPVDYGITPGSGPGHLGVFGYEPVEHMIGRGILEALGIDVTVDSRTITARCNFCTVDDAGSITDRRAGRIPTSENERLIKRLSESISEINGFPVEFYSGKEHRFVFIVRNFEAAANVNDTDPQQTGVRPLKAVSSDNGDSGDAADIINTAYEKINSILKNEKANSVLFRGISKLPDIEPMSCRFSIKPACIATYPMYRGLSKLVGMDIIKTGDTIEDEIEALQKHLDDYDYFFLHVKKTDSYGEDGDFMKKVSIIEEFDSLLPRIEQMGFTVITITGDHSTPSSMKAHSHHAVPILIKSPNHRVSPVKAFGETQCLYGSLGQFKAKYIINLMLAGAGRLAKFGA